MVNAKCVIQAAFSSCNWSGVAATPREMAEARVINVSPSAVAAAPSAMERIRLRCSGVRSGRNTMTSAATVVTHTTVLSRTDGRSIPVLAGAGVVAGTGVAAGGGTLAGTGATVAGGTVAAGTVAATGTRAARTGWNAAAS